MRDVYKIITDRVITLLEAGTVPWQRPWGGESQRPRNLVSDKPYRGINVFLLSAAAYESPYWLTYRQAAERGGYVKKGEHGLPCVFYNWQERVDEKSGEVERRPFLRYYTVFNVQQCDDLRYPVLAQPESTFEPIDRCEHIVQGMPQAPTIEHGFTQACYVPTRDAVQMPARERFCNEESYYSALFHELVHSTGHSSRLKRPGITERPAFGSPQYSREELIAEMGATFLCGQAGIENAIVDNSAAYIASWLKRLRSDSRLVVQAAGQAQKAADWILGVKPEPPTE